MESDFSDFLDDSFTNEGNESNLKKQVRFLQKKLRNVKTQVRQLKKIAMLNVFGSKAEFEQFMKDIW
jgi:hypothetical protein